ncbi:uncharacterized protein C1orf131 [Athalia rosae]|uniref:uncharacterized protein C1orf131 n=1 Tax=Athalia rosae TaxID=37344 RepID=UPI0020347C40|nr:uncharacterized protein C1orf131 [Athalia rosae]
MSGFVVTRGAISKENAVRDFVAVSYTAPKKKKQSIGVNPKGAGTGIGLSHGDLLLKEPKKMQAADIRKEQDKQMKRARFDVIKFGMSGFDGVKGEEAKIALAVKLGAKPPKKKAKNYKELKLERQKANKEAQKKASIPELGKFSAKPSFDKKRRKDPGLLNNYGIVKKNAVTITNNKRF